MKTKHLFWKALPLLALLAQQSAQAALYNDSTTGEGTIVSGYSHLNISSVTVNNDADYVTFQINLVGDPVNTTWGKYMIGFDTTSGGATSGNGWSRPISMSSGMDYWLGSWVDAGNGANFFKWTDSAWSQQDITGGTNPDGLSISKNGSSVTLSFKYSGMGLSTGNSFLFDVYTSGATGTDGAVDALGNSGQTIADWGNSYDTGASALSYTITAVPEPVTAALVIFGVGLGMLGVRRYAYPG